MFDRRSAVAFCVVFLLQLLFRSGFQQSTPLSSGVELLALLQLRSSLGLRAREWPIKSDPCLNWTGVQCRSGRVIGINITDFRRTRIGRRNPQFAVDSLSNFSRLESFSASRFPLPGSIPDWFGLRLVSLQLLDLRSCSIGGAIPSSIGNLTNLRTLYLSRNRLTGVVPSSLGQLSQLSVLDLSHNSLTGSITPSFSSLLNLTLLDMSSNFFSGTIPPAIGSLSSLQSLNLSGNSLSSSIPSQLSDLSSLINLDLSFNALSGSIPSALRRLRNLQRMVAGNNSLGGSLPGNLFPPLTRLQFLILSHNNFSGDLPNVLWSMPQLQFLDVSGNDFAGILPNLSLNSNITAGAVFNLSGNMFYGNITPIIRRFGFIDLSGNYFQGEIDDFARSNASLTRNCLSNVPNQRTRFECRTFYSGRGLTFDDFGNPNATPPSPPRSNNNNHRRTLIIVAGVLGSLILISLVVVLSVLFFLCGRKRDSSTNQRSNGVGPAPTGTTPPSSGSPLNFSTLGDEFTYKQILQATGEFSESNLIKHGHSGDLFKGILDGGIHVVIKRIDLGSVKKEAFMLELEFFTKVSHPRLIPLLGHCLENENEKFLIYKFMPNGDLSSSLFRKPDSEDDSMQTLDWITRLKIAIGAAEGLAYLHHECSPPLVHRDVQASSILLDDKYEVRLGSLSEVCAQEGDAHQSRITRLLRLPQTSEQGASGTPTSTCAYDVYCFGKVLLELVTGRVGLSTSADSSMKDFMEVTLPYINIYDKELVTNIVDPNLIIDEDLLEEVWAMAIVARSCLNPKPSRRPLMRYILKALENPLKVVREEHTGSARLRATSSRSSWNAALFGSWRSSSDVAAIPAGPVQHRGEGTSSFKQSGTTSGSQGSGGRNGDGVRSSSTRRQSNDVFPEPLDGEDTERRNDV